MLIGELAERTGVSRRALRYYEEQGLLVPDRARNGYREYPEDAPLIVEQVQHLIASGLTSEAIRQFLPCVRGKEPRLEMCDELRAHLTERVAILTERADTASRQRDALLAHLS
jgi:DNA-binding transcriptional MerR regulator